VTLLEGGAFRGLGTALKVRGGKGAPSEADLDNLIPVIDLASFASYNSGQIWGLNFLNTHVGTGSISNNINLWDPTAADGFLPVAGFEMKTDEELVIMAMGVQVSETTDMEGCDIQLRGTEPIVGINQAASGAAEITIFRSVSAGGIGSIFTAIPIDGFLGAAYPYRIREGTFLRMRSRAQVSGTITFEFNFLMLQRQAWYVP